MSSHTDGTEFMQVGEYLKRKVEEGDTVRVRGESGTGTVITVDENSTSVIIEGEDSARDFDNDDVKRESLTIHDMISKQEYIDANKKCIMTRNVEVSISPT